MSEYPHENARPLADIVLPQQPMYWETHEPDGQVVRIWVAPDPAYRDHYLQVQSWTGHARRYVHGIVRTAHVVIPESARQVPWWVFWQAYEQVADSLRRYTPSPVQVLTEVPGPTMN